MTTKYSCAVVALLSILPAAGFGETAQEYAVKASYIARITEFVDWPDEAIAQDNAQAFVVSVIGVAPFRDVFERTFSATTIKNKVIQIRYVATVDEIEGSQILFISGSEAKNLEEIVAFTRDKPILTVSDTAGFARQGVAINFYQANQRIAFEINPSALDDTGLHISSLLLDFARIVDPDKGEER